MADNARPTVDRWTKAQIAPATTTKTGNCIGTEPGPYPCPRARNPAGNPVKLSTPPVNPSARPRKSENVPRVTIKGGIRNRVTHQPLNAPATVPTPRVSAAAAAVESPQSRQKVPNRTADSPINDPTERSIPPARIKGVNATAIRPTSTASRNTSKPLPTEKKLVPIAEKTATSTAIRASSTPCEIAGPGFGVVGASKVISPPGPGRRRRPQGG